MTGSGHFVTCTFSRFNRVEACDRLPSRWRLDRPPYMHIMPFINLLNDLVSYFTFFLLGLSPRTGYRYLLECLLSVLRGTHPVVDLLTQIQFLFKKYISRKHQQLRHFRCLLAMHEVPLSFSTSLLFSGGFCFGVGMPCFI